MTARTIRNFVGGDFVEGGESGCFDKINPVDGRTGALVYEADAAMIDRAVRVARAALERQWGRTTADQRAEVLRKVADRIEDGGP